MATQQIAVRIPEALVQFVDSEVAAEHAASRADLIARALRREQRRLKAERDAAIYAALAGEPDEFEAMTAHASRTPLDID
ncbi:MULTISPECIES: antitoxin [Nocardia]|uniref:antitoxin n=1 Tax=Nocardia TaxID=1817 RepID=UPI0018930694|nr:MULTISPECIES: antitoxin [Nocardia]MBF6349947.1 antitoxin [Nocardia flavorosea]